MKETKIGFIGLGQMGRGMARNVVKAGFPTFVYDLNKEVLRELQQCGATIAKSCKDVGMRSDVVITMVRDDHQTEDVVRQVLKGIKKEGIILVMSTVSPSLIRSLARRSKREKGVYLLDAPVSGLQTKADEGTLCIMVGGNKQAFKKSRAILETMGNRIFHCGKVGTGEVAKITNGAICISNMGILAQVIPLGLKQGLRPDVQRKIYESSTGASYMLSQWDNLNIWRKDPKFVELQTKDLKLGLELAEESKMRLPIASATYDFDFLIKD